MAKKKTIAELWRELTGGGEYIVGYSAHDGKPLRWHWLDWPIMMFADVLKFTGLPKGRIESYSRRGLWELDYHGSQPGGSGHHVLYSPRSVLKLIAIDRLTEAGAWPECLKANFGKNRQFDLILNDYQFRFHKDAERDGGEFDRTLTMNDAYWRYRRLHGKSPEPKHGDPWYTAGPAPEDWIQLHFDVAAFLWDIMPRLIRFFAHEGVKLKD